MQAKIVSEALVRHVAEVKIIPPTRIAAKGDLWIGFEAGGTRDQLMKLWPRPSAFEVLPAYQRNGVAGEASPPENEHTARLRRRTAPVHFVFGPFPYSDSGNCGTHPRAPWQGHPILSPPEDLVILMTFAGALIGAADDAHRRSVFDAALYEER